MKPKIQNEGIRNSNGDIESGYLLTHRASLPSASQLQHISGDIAQKSGVSVREIVGALYHVCFDPFQLSSDIKCTVY